MADSGRTNHPTLLAINTANKINRLSGGVVIRPWEVQDIPPEWLIAFEGLYDLPDMKKPIDEQRAMMEQMAQSNPNYNRKH